MNQTDNIDCAACFRPIHRDGKSIRGVGLYLDSRYNNYCSKGCRWIGRREKDKPVVSSIEAEHRFQLKERDRKRDELKLEQEFHDDNEGFGWPVPLQPIFST